MDTKTPPIPLKPQERISQSRKTERVADVSLPPLTPYPSNRPKNRLLDPVQQQQQQQHHHRREQRKNRPYRVLEIGATPLMHACQQGDRARVLKLLKEQEETIAYRDRTLRSALHYCMEAGTGGAVAAAAPELVNAPDAEGHTPLHLAVIAGDTQLVAVLLANGADVNAKDLEGHSVLHWATVCGEAECVRLVLAAGAQSSTPDLRGGSPLHYAAQCCGAAATAQLAVPKKIGLQVLQTLLEFGADVNAKDEDGRQPILWAASAGSVEAVLALARAGGSAAAGTSDKDGLTALHCAASRGHARCVEALVNLCGSQPDHVDDNGCSALHYAATLGHADATALILKLGADPNRQDRKGRTPALCAAAKGQLETLKILTVHGGSLHVRTVRGTGIGHEAVASGRIELIKWLAKRRPSTLDVATHDGKTPLHVAALHGHLDVCKVLLDHGARINAVLKTSRGNAMTPLDAALYRGHRDCAKLIQMHGGTMAQQLRSRSKAQPRNTDGSHELFTAKLRVKHAESSTASDSSPPELYYEERWMERRTRRKGNLRKLARRDSPNFSEEEQVRLSKTSSRRDEKRARSESARCDANNERDSLREKLRRRTGSTRRRHKYEYSDSSDESSDSCDCSHDRNRPSIDRNSVHRRARKRHERKDKDSNEATRVGDDSRKEDDRSVSVSDDSLVEEVIVVKKSLEKKCEKLISGRRLKTPRECTKETKLTKTQKRSSRRMSRSAGRSKVSDENAARFPTESPEEKDKSANDTVTKLRDGDMTDSTSRETVERVVVTAMIHKDQMPDTPKSIFETTSLDEEVLKKKKKEGVMETDETLRDDLLLLDGPTDENETVLSREIDSAVDESRRKDRQLQDDEPTISDAQQEVTNNATRDGSKNHRQVDEKCTSLEDENDSPQRSTTTVDDTSVLDRVYMENEKLSTCSRVKPDKCDDDAESKTTPEDDVETAEVAETIDKASSFEAAKSLAGENQVQQDAEALTFMTERSIDGTDDLDDSAHGKSADLSSAESRSSRLNVEEIDKGTGNVETGDKDSRYMDGSCSSSPKPVKSRRPPRPSTGRKARTRARTASITRRRLFESSEERRSSGNRSAIVAVIDSPEWADEDEAQVEKEIREAFGEDAERETEHEEDNGIVARVLPSTSEEETPTAALAALAASRSFGIDSLPQVVRSTGSNNRFVTIVDSSGEGHGEGSWRKQRRDSGGRDSGIEPSPRVSKIPQRRNVRCCPNTTRQQALNMETVTRDVQISLRRYHLERKIFFQLMELKRLQIRHGRANEHVLVKRQVEAFHRSGMSGPTLGVARYDRQFTFRDFEAFLYEQLRRLQGRPTTPDFCTEAKQCTRKTHRCHHATSAYTSVPVYTYLGGSVPDRAEHLPKIESRGKGQMTVEVTHGEEKQVIALPTERLDRTKRYFVTFTVRGETREEKAESSCTPIRRNAKSV